MLMRKGGEVQWMGGDRGRGGILLLASYENRISRPANLIASNRGAWESDEVTRPITCIMCL